jgi:putative SOS response-associated peptidase YedK
MHQRLAPTMSAPVVRRHPESEERHLDLLTWGLVPSFTKDFKAARKPINARAETVASSGMFKNALAKRRCLVPAAAFYEWKATPEGKVPGAIARADGDPLAFAGIWDGWRSPGGDVLRSFVIITTEANAQMSALHSRMSVHPGAGGLAPFAGRGGLRRRNAAPSRAESYPSDLAG